MSALRRLLVVMPCPPWPPRRNGVTVRYVPLLRHLRRLYEVDVLVIGEEPADDVPADARGGLCARLESISLPPGAEAPLALKLRMRARELMPGRPSLIDTGYFGDEVQAQLGERLGRTRYDTVLWVGRTHLPALADLLERAERPRVVVDFIDSPVLAEERAATGAGNSRALAQLRLGKIRDLERRIRARADQVIYIAAPDAHAVQSPGPNVAIVPNGVLVEDLAEPIHAPLPPGRYLGFLGNMTYEPNSEAVLRLHDRIFVPLSAEFPELKLLVIGRSPDERLLALRSDRVIVTGEVDSVWPYVDQAEVFAFPLRRGAGLQNKILEAMMRARPTVFPTPCNLSLGAAAGRQALIADNDEQFRDAVSRLLRDSAFGVRLGRAGCDFVKRSFDWEVLAPRLAALLEPSGGGAPPGRRSAQPPDEASGGGPHVPLATAQP